MKVAITGDGENAEVKIFDLVRSESVYFQGDSMHSGYVIADEDDVLHENGEYIGFQLRMSMYEGGWLLRSESWSEGLSPMNYMLLPESAAEWNHLAAHCNSVLTELGDVGIRIHGLC